MVMALYSVLTLMLLASVAMVTGLSVLPGTDPILPPSELGKLLFPKKFPRGPTTAPPPHLKWPPRYCTCEIRCCKHSLQKRRAISAEMPALGALLNSPLVRHKRCCGCHPCDFLRLKA